MGSWAATARQGKGGIQEKVLAVTCCVQALGLTRSPAPHSQRNLKKASSSSSKVSLGWRRQRLVFADLGCKAKTLGSGNLRRTVGRKVESTSAKGCTARTPPTSMVTCFRKDT